MQFITVVAGGYFSYNIIASPDISRKGDCILGSLAKEWKKASYLKQGKILLLWKKITRKLEQIQ